MFVMKEYNLHLQMSISITDWLCIFVFRYVWNARNEQCMHEVLMNEEFMNETSQRGVWFRYECECLI